MHDLPFMQFYVADWIRDTRMLDLAAKGAWIDTLAILWGSETRGVHSATLDGWARLWGVAPDYAPAILDQLEQVAGIRRENAGKTPGNGRESEGNPPGEVAAPDPRQVRVTIFSRRMLREELERERTRNAKRPEERREWRVRDLLRARIPELFPENSRNVPADFPPDISEVRGQRVHSAGGANGKRPTIDQARAAAHQIGVAIDVAEKWWNARESTDWIKPTAAGGTIAVGQNWQADLKTYADHRSSAAPADHRSAKRSREFPEPRRPLPDA